MFILNPQGAPTTHTVPRPFKLHESTHQVGHQQAVESSAACCTVGCKLSVLCTFSTQAADLDQLDCATLSSYTAQPFREDTSRNQGWCACTLLYQGCCGLSWSPTDLFKESLLMYSGIAHLIISHIMENQRHLLLR